MREASESPGKREQTKARNRSVILDAARRVFVEIGYDAATIRDIVAETDLSPGTFYNYFPDKQSVLIALCADISSEGSRRAHEARKRATSMEQLAYDSFRAYFEFVVQERAMFGLLRRNLAALRTLGIDATGFQRGVTELRADLEVRARQGAFPSLPMNYVPQAIAAMAFEVACALAEEDTPDVEAATRFASELCIGGLERLARIHANADSRSASPSARTSTKRVTKSPVTKSKKQHTR